MATLVRENTDRSSGAPATATSESEPAERRGRKRWIVLPLLLVLAGAGGVWAYRHWAYGQTHVTTDNATVDGELIPVVAKVGGYATLVGVHENDHVGAGATVVRIDPSEYQVRLAQATAD